jgi:hypothetical protein
LEKSNLGKKEKKKYEEGEKTLLIEANLLPATPKGRTCI